MAATSNTHNKDESLALVAPVFTISARLFQVEKKIDKDGDHKQGTQW